MKLIIAGVPKSGKSTLAAQYLDESHYPGEELGSINHSDIFISRPWSEQSRLAMSWLDEPSPWICEGVTMVRATRKWLQSHWDDDEKPCDKFIFLQTNYQPLIDAQRRLAKGCITIFQSIDTELKERGVQVELR